MLFNRRAGTYNGVSNCYIYQVGSGGVNLGGGDRATLTPAHNYVENCRIHDFNRIEKSYRPGIWIDGVGNRIASTVFGHEELYLVVGRNKLAPDYDGAVWRARNVASPKNAIRLQRKTPCAVKGDKCYDCNSPERLCRGMTVLWQASNGIGRTEVVLIDEDLGF